MNKLTFTLAMVAGLTFATNAVAYNSAWEPGQTGNNSSQSFAEKNCQYYGGCGNTSTTPSNNNYRPGFSAGMMNKDLKLANDCAKSVNAETPLGKMALEIYDQFCKEGNDTKDFSAISKVIGGSAWDYPID